MVATQEQMDAARLPLEQRDYCAHHLLRLMKCRRDYFPNLLACRAQRHDWDYCEHLEYVPGPLLPSPVISGVEAVPGGGIW